ncbi:hypothetical protein FSP39_004148 [Pinctada imbricata]|uniref:Ubiquitin-like domain-containing protein n=1 Tax=Pinctada imbricata TaxID=66713 RepID=A0AA89BZV1_PINIB|nr:hypothetical protein FSP39_004148 [Pinctada imbricata]
MALVDIYVKLPSGRTSTIQLYPTAQISQINKHVATEEGVPDDRVILKYQGKVLDRNKTVGQYGVRPETILKGEVIFPKDITVYVKLPDGRSVPVQTQNVSNISSIKSFLESTEGLEGSKHCVKVSDVRVNKESQPLFSIGVQEESILQLCVKEDSASSRPSENTVEQEAPEELKEAIFSSFQSNGRRVEVVFSFDTTGSMNSYLVSVRTNLKETCRRLVRDIRNIRIGIMAHGDYCDSLSSYTIRHIDLTSDVDQLVDFAENTPSTCGGDTPECYELVLQRAQQLDWSEDSAKALVVIGDCEPHPPSYTDQAINWWTEVDVLHGMGVKIYGVHCNNTKTKAYNFYAEVADKTEGCVLKLKHFSLITEMFLGVCYNEAAPEQLEAFTEELRQDGKLTEEAATLMKEISKTKSGGACGSSTDKSGESSSNKDKDKEKRYVAEPWWDISLDKTTTPRYLYDQNTDKWRERNEPAAPAKIVSHITTSISTTSHGNKKSVKRTDKKCSIM